MRDRFVSPRTVRPRPARILRAPLLCAALLWAATAPAVLAQAGAAGEAAPVLSAEGTLEPGQTVEIRIGRWDPVEEAFVSWDGLGGRFLIGPEGVLTLPVAGAFEVTDLSPGALADKISAQLQGRLGTRGDVQAIVTIAAFAPIYVLGDVRAPGAYTHTPGMTVLQALTLAGGLDTPGAQLLQGGRNALTSIGTYQVLQFDLLRRLATLARLRAELNDTEIDPPQELSGATMGTELIDQEREILQARQTALRSNLSQIDDLETLLERQIAQLDTQVTLREEQLALLEDNLANVQNLLERGLTTADRGDSLQRQVADQRIRLLELETARLNAEQRLNEAGRDRLDLTNERRRELVEGAKDQEAAIRELRIKMETEAALFAESSRTGTRIVNLLDGAEARMEVTRVADGKSTTMPVARSDRIRGGDVLEVILPAPATTFGGTAPPRIPDGDGTGQEGTEPSGTGGPRMDLSGPGAADENPPQPSAASESLPGSDRDSADLPGPDTGTADPPRVGAGTADPPVPMPEAAGSGAPPRPDRPASATGGAAAGRTAD